MARKPTRPTLRVHFMADPCGDKEMYQRIIAIVEKEAGSEVVTDHAVSRVATEITEETPTQSQDYYDESIQWIQQADVVVFEVTLQNVSTGLELARALYEYHKDVIVLYNEDATPPAPFSLQGVDMARLEYIHYTPATLESLLHRAFTRIHRRRRGRKIQVILPLELRRYLDWILETKSDESMSGYLRSLLEQDMERNTTYQQHTKRPR